MELRTNIPKLFESSLHRTKGTFLNALEGSQDRLKKKETATHPSNNPFDSHDTSYSSISVVVGMGRLIEHTQRLNELRKHQVHEVVVGEGGDGPLVA